MNTSSSPHSTKMKLRTYTITATHRGWFLNDELIPRHSFRLPMSNNHRVRFHIKPENLSGPNPKDPPGFIMIERVNPSCGFRLPVILDTFLPEDLPPGSYAISYCSNNGFPAGELSGTLNVGMGDVEEDEFLDDPQTEAPTSAPR